MGDLTQADLVQASCRRARLVPASWVDFVCKSVGLVLGRAKGGCIHRRGPAQGGPSSKDVVQPKGEGWTLDQGLSLFRKHCYNARPRAPRSLPTSPVERVARPLPLASRWSPVDRQSWASGRARSAQTRPSPAAATRTAHRGWARPEVAEWVGWRWRVSRDGPPVSPVSIQYYR